MKPEVEATKPKSNEDPFITKNVWIKRLGLCILLIGLYPSLLAYSEVNLILKIVIGMAIATYAFKQIRGFFKSFMY